tara:strand:+ start:61 stop:324 length:264 start_codon:yes stop_codon:yes gene_type:complete
MIRVTIQSGYWLKENLTLDVSTIKLREEAVKTLEGFIHSLPHKVKEYNESLDHMYVEYTNTYICHMDCQDEYLKTGIKQPVTEIVFI